jgi:hypothetical protein
MRASQIFRNTRSAKSRAFGLADAGLVQSRGLHRIRTLVEATHHNHTVGRNGTADLWHPSSKNPGSYGGIYDGWASSYFSV